MEITEKSDVAAFSLPLPLYSSIPLADAKSSDGEEFEITVGLAKKCADEIKEHSLDDSDEELQKNTGDRKRFGEGSYEEWYAKYRTPFCLIHKKTGTLAAFVWFGPKALGKKSLRLLSEKEAFEADGAESGQWHTFVYRSYNPFRGKGLMKDFSKFAMKIYSEKYPGVRYWVGVNPENKASIGLASSLGFSVSEENSDRSGGWLVMIK